MTYNSSPYPYVKRLRIVFILLEIFLDHDLYNVVRNTKENYSNNAIWESPPLGRGNALKFGP